MTNFFLFSRIKVMGTDDATFRYGIQYLTEWHSCRSSPESNNIRGAYLRNVLYFSVIGLRGSKLSFRAKNCIQ